MVANVIDDLNKEALKTNLPAIKIGDTISVHVRILEGDKERIQVYTGSVIARNGTSGNKMITVRRISHGVGVERIFPLHSPFIDKIVVDSSSDVRRSKLYYLRRRVGKQAKLRPNMK